MKTKQVLGIYWDSVVGEVGGQTFYLLKKDIAYSSPDFPLFLWPKNTEVKKHKLHGDSWVVWLWDLKFSAYPEDWKAATQRTLLFFVDSGAEISWCGLDGCFSDPPNLFDPKQMSGGVYAATYKGTRFLCHTELDGEFRALDDSELIKLKHAASLQ